MVRVNPVTALWTTNESRAASGQPMGDKEKPLSSDYQIRRRSVESTSTVSAGFFLQASPQARTLESFDWLILSRRTTNHDSMSHRLLDDMKLVSRGSIDSVGTTLTETSQDSDDRPPTSPGVKRKLFRTHLTLVVSCMYGVFVVTFGIMIYVQALLTSQPTIIVEIFSIYLVVVGLLYFIFLKVDTSLYLKRTRDRRALVTSYPGTPDEKIERAFGDEKKSGTELSHDYCFSTGRHSGSFYLKAGAAVFCFGLIINSGCLVGYQVFYLRNSLFTCGSVPRLIRDVLHPIYALFQLYFIFKHSNVIINRFKEGARFALMHCIATSLCMWAWTILDETLHMIHVYSLVGDHDSTAPVSHDQTFTTEMSHGMNQSRDCEEYDNMSETYGRFSPYLFPFTIEYSIMIAGILFIIWQNIGNCPDTLDNPDDLCNVAEYSEQRMLLHADCRSASRGLFAGLLILALSVISIILFCVVIADSQWVDLGMKVNKITAIIILVLMTIAAAIAYHQVTHLDVSSHPVDQLDDLLLFVCIPAYFMYAIFSIMPAISNGDKLTITKVSFQVIQILIQTPMIMDGLRRCSNSKALRKDTPGKELITFLIICNISMWINETFQIKSTSLKDYHYDQYGVVMWILIKHMSVPLQMFYRFHSSVCLVDIWKTAYKKDQGFH